MAVDTPQPVVLDLRGLSCAFVLAEVVRALETADVVEVINDHSTTLNETLPEFCRTQGYECVRQPEAYPLGESSYRVRIARQ